MCYEAVDYVTYNSKQRCGKRLVLLECARMMPRDGFGWWKIGYPLLAERANVDRRHVMRLVWDLAKSGELGVRFSKGRGANEYRVAMSPGEVEHNRKTFALIEPELKSQRSQKRPKQCNSVKNVTVEADVESVKGAVSSTRNSDISDTATVTFLDANSDIFDAPVEGAIGGGVSLGISPGIGPELSVKHKDSVSSTFDVSECVATLPLETFPVDSGAHFARERSTQPNNWVAVWGDFKRRLVGEIVEVTGDAQSLRRFGQLFDVCETACRGDLWEVAVKATKSAVDRWGADLEAPGAYFQKTLGQLCRDNDVDFPFGTKAERDAVKAAAKASTAVAKSKQSRSP